VHNYDFIAFLCSFLSSLIKKKKIDHIIDIAKHLRQSGKQSERSIQNIRSFDFFFKLKSKIQPFGKIPPF
jgi:hypothetical protein